MTYDTIADANTDAVLVRAHTYDVLVRAHM